jgi:hypothetical protein
LSRFIKALVKTGSVWAFDRKARCRGQT